jgi:hypothetical protein
MPRAVFPRSVVVAGSGPDPEALADAMLRLRDQLGVDAVFVIPGEQAWPEGTPLDPETGRPFDPFLEPETTTDAQEITLRCSFVHRPLAQADPQTSPIGAMDTGSAALIVAQADYPQVADARRARVGEEVWDIQLWRHDTALRVGRWIAYLEHA